MDLMELAEEKGNTKLAAIYWANAKRIYGEEVDEIVQR
jgi:hypothetical protein